MMPILSTSTVLNTNRGCGKTTLLEQLSRRALERGWTSIDINSENALETLMRFLERNSSVVKEVAPEVEVSVFGTGGRFGGISSTKTKEFPKENIEVIFLEACQRQHKGLLLTIDEIQKISLDDLSQICGAFQIASRKGYDVMLTVAGLPYAYKSVVQHEGCTYMRRSSHILLSVFTHAEARAAFQGAFGCIDGLSVKDEALESLVQASYGHPYFIQLMGYALVERMNLQGAKAPCRISRADVEAVLPEVLRDYEQRSLEPILSALSRSERCYLDSMAKAMNADHKAKAGDVAQIMGKNSRQVSSVKQSLLDAGIIVAVAHGEAMFNIPYLRTYLLKRPNPYVEAALAQEWTF